MTNDRLSKDELVSSIASDEAGKSIRNIEIEPKEVISVEQILDVIRSYNVLIRGDREKARVPIYEGLACALIEKAYSSIERTAVADALASLELKGEKTPSETTLTNEIKESRFWAMNVERVIVTAHDCITGLRDIHKNIDGFLSFFDLEIKLLESEVTLTAESKAEGIPDAIKTLENIKAYYRNKIRLEEEQEVVRNAQDDWFENGLQIGDKNARFNAISYDSMDKNQE
jgi:hypothetical protein